MSFLVAKADGATEAFEASKLTRSLIKSGADEESARSIVDAVQSELSIRSGKGEVMTTQEIYSHAFHQLRDVQRPLAARYSLKRAVLSFGPTGFPFEEFLSQLFKREGYVTAVDQIVKGGCVEHEVDIVLTKNKQTTFVEAKFHNSLAYKSDLKIALYVQARIEDLLGGGHAGAQVARIHNPPRGVGHRPERTRRPPR